MKDISSRFYQWDEVKDFTFDDFMCLNGSFSTKYFSPDNNIYKKSSTIDFYKDYGFYEVTQKYWPYPTRLFYNREQGIAHRVTGTNNIFYGLNKQTKLFKYLDNENIDEKCIRYIRMFFDNVEGKHGMFHVFENYQELEYLVKLFFQLNPDKLSGYSSRADQAIVKKLIRDSVFSYAQAEGFGIRLISNNSTEKIFERTYEVYLLFKGNPFWSEVTIKTDPENNDWGLVSLVNESMVIRDISSNKKTHPLQKWDGPFTDFGFEDYLPPIHLMQISAF